MVDKITRLLRVDRKWPFALTIRAIADPHFLRRILIERPQDSTTLPTIKLDILQLRKHPAPARHHARHPHQIIQIRSAQVAQGRRKREVGYAHVHFGVDALVLGVVDEDGGKGYFVEDGEHGGGRVGEEVGEDGFRECKVEVRDLERLGVRWLRVWSVN